MMCMDLVDSHVGQGALSSKRVVMVIVWFSQINQAMISIFLFFLHVKCGGLATSL